MSSDESLKKNHTQALYELANELSSQNVIDIRFLLKNGSGFGSRDVDEKGGLELMELLMKSSRISPSGNDFLKELLLDVKRKDLVIKYFGSGKLFLEMFGQFPIPYQPPSHASMFSFEYGNALAEPKAQTYAQPAFDSYNTPSNEDSVIGNPSYTNNQDQVSSVASSTDISTLSSAVSQCSINPTSSIHPEDSASQCGTNSTATIRSEDGSAHRMANLKQIDSEFERVVYPDPNETFAKRIDVAQSRASNTNRNASVDEDESMASTSANAEESMASSSSGAQSSSSGAQSSSSGAQSTDTESVQTDGTAWNNLVSVQADGVHDGGAIGRAMAEDLADQGRSRTTESALDRVMSAVKTTDFQVFASLPTIAGTDQIDHDRILAEIGMRCEMRGYQRSLAEAGLKGENNIVVLQTGGGKTHISAYITKYHQEKALAEDKKFLAVFIVPIRHLAEQQGNVFEDIEEEDREAFSSMNVGVAKNNDEFMDHVRKKKVIFCTAQILINVLRDKNLQINMKHFSQVIIDECHRTTGRHPNNRVMEQYLRAKLEKDLHLEAPEDLYKPSVSTDLPQIIGLTASLGAGDSKSDDRKSLAKAAYDHLSFLCSNIDALKVVFPSTKEEKDSLGRHCPDPASEELVPAQRRPDRNFYKILRTFVEEMVTDVEKVDLKKVEFGGSEAFHYFKALIPADGRLDNELHIAVKYLMEFNKAFDKLTILRCSDVLHFLETNEELPFYSPDVDIRDDFVRRTKELWDKYVDRMKIHAAAVDQNPLPIMKKLKEKLLLMFQNSSSRGILLLRERYATTALTRFIEDDVDLKQVTRPTRLVGHEEMTDKQVDESLDKFRSGECNLLVATDIAQEGIDIKECNFVIRYSFVSNAIGTIQAIGRARMEGSQCFLLVLRDSPEEDQEKKVRAKVQAMDDALSVYLKKDSSGEWERKVNDHQKKSYESRKQNRKTRAIALDAASKYDIVCAQCQTLITPADEVVKILETNHHLLSGDFREVVVQKPLVSEKVYNDHGDEVDRLNGIYCAHCDTHKLGVEFVFRRGFFFTGPQVTIKAEQVKYKERSKGLLLPRGKFKWKDAPFKVKTESKTFEMDPEFSSDDDDFEF